MKKSTYTTNNAFLVSAPAMAVSRMCGLAPLAVRKVKGQILLEWSTKYAIYSFLLAVLLGELFYTLDSW